tara:strand:+ start:317 stop:481 length:165 start_codon:yes stop_codon:yes gene_type:complete
VDLAYEACVLDVLRCGVRCVQLRSPKHGTRIVGCALLVRITRDRCLRVEQNTIP